MVRKARNIEDQIRSAIKASEMTRYRLSELSKGPNREGPGVSEGQLSRFMMDKDDPRHRTLTLTSAARVAEVLGLEIRPKPKESR